MRNIRSAVKQAVFSKDLLIGLIGVIAVVFAASVSDIFKALRAEGPLPNAFHNSFIENAIVSDAMKFALPIIAALPFTASFVNDLKSGFLKSYLHRTSRKDYIAGKCMACAVSGGAVLALGIVASYLISAIVFLPMEDTMPTDAAYEKNSPGVPVGCALVFVRTCAFSNDLQQIHGICFTIHHLLYSDHSA